MPESGGAGEVGDLAIVLHAHMPYVEGYGTYPFGEEWLFDAYIRSHLPVLEVARDLTLTVTPVLADQLEAPGVQDRLRRFLEQNRIAAAAKDVDSCDPEYRAAAGAQLELYTRALALLDATGGDLLGPFRRAQGRGVALAPSSATHAILPLLATDAGIDLQIGSGTASHERRFGRGEGFWLPECAWRPGTDVALARNGIEWFCLYQEPGDPDDEALEPVLTPAGPLAFTIDWPAVSWLWDMGGYPSWPGYRDFHRLSINGLHIFGIDGDPYRPESARQQAEAQASEFLRDAADRLAAFRRRTGRRGLITCAFDCELLGHWWAEGPIWLEAVLARAEVAGIRLVNLDRAMSERRAGGPLREHHELLPSTWGEAKDFRTWDSPAVSDLARGARRLELKVVEAIRRGLEPAAAERAARELLMVQASDWAFLDGRGEAGDYPYQRTLLHSQSAFEALHSGVGVKVDPAVRSLAPDLNLVPLLVP